MLTGLFAGQAGVCLYPLPLRLAEPQFGASRRPPSWLAEPTCKSGNVPPNIQDDIWLVCAVSQIANPLMRFLIGIDEEEPSKALLLIADYSQGVATLDPMTLTETSQYRSAAKALVVSICSQDPT